MTSAPREKSRLTFNTGEFGFEVNFQHGQQNFLEETYEVEKKKRLYLQLVLWKEPSSRRAATVGKFAEAR